MPKPTPRLKTSAQFKKEFDERREALKGSKYFPCEAPGYQERETKRVELGMDLSFTKLNDGSCDVFADVLEVGLTAKRIEFVKCEPFQQDTPEHMLFNVPYETLKKFAQDILEVDKEKIDEDKNENEVQETPEV